jgi:cell division septation protein DedD
MKFCAVALLISLLAAPALTIPASAGVKEGIDAWQAGDYAKAITEWRGPAKAGDADAQYNLAHAYQVGQGVPADPKLAQDWYLKAANQGHEEAQTNLGLILFRNGDRSGALPWLQKASDRGEPRAQYVLGTAHFNGDLVPRDWVKAYALMTHAAASGLPQAATSLSQMDQYVPLAQRQQGIAMAKEMDKPAPRPLPAPKSATPVKSVTAPPPPAKPAQAATATRASGWRVQLGAFRTADAARAAWKHVSNRSGLKGLQPAYVSAGAITRLQAGPLASRALADEACKSAKAAGSACLVLAP